jgi:outer membrane receptor protein involved in Fe transport
MSVANSDMLRYDSRSQVCPTTVSLPQPAFGEITATFPPTGLSDNAAESVILGILVHVTVTAPVRKTFRMLRDISSNAISR